MNKSIPCKICKTNFELTESQEKFVVATREKKMTFIMLECSNCGHHTDFNPNEGNIESEKETIAWRTPVSKITGLVSFIEDGENSFYGCGESGFMWRTKERFYQSIEEIIEKYPHRKDCYKKEDGEWLPNKNEPKNMEALIEGEDENDLDKYEIT